MDAHRSPHCSNRTDTYALSVLHQYLFLTFHPTHSADTQFTTLLLCLEVVVTLQRSAGFVPFPAMYYLNAPPLSNFWVVRDTAYRSSQYLSSLLDHGLIEPDPSLELDKLYASFASSSRISPNLPPPTLAPTYSEKKSTTGDVAADRKSEAASGTGASQPERILLTRRAMPHILKMFRLPESTIANMYRAMDQARGRLGASSSSNFS